MVHIQLVINLQRDMVLPVNRMRQVIQLLVLFYRGYSYQTWAKQQSWETNPPCMMNFCVCSIVAGSGGSTPSPCSGSSVYGANVGWDNRESLALCVGPGGRTGSGDGDDDGEGSSTSRLKHHCQHQNLQNDTKFKETTTCKVQVQKTSKTK